jgi:hypothetical protein
VDAQKSVVADSHHIDEKLDPDPHQSEYRYSDMDPDPHQGGANPQHCLEVNDLYSIRQRLFYCINFTSWAI